MSFQMPAKDKNLSLLRLLFGSAERLCDLPFFGVSFLSMSDFPHRVYSKRRSLWPRRKHRPVPVLPHKRLIVRDHLAQTAARIVAAEGGKPGLALRIRQALKRRGVQDALVVQKDFGEVFERLDGAVHHLAVMNAAQLHSQEARFP